MEVINTEHSLIHSFIPCSLQLRRNTALASSSTYVLATALGGMVGCIAERDLNSDDGVDDDEDDDEDDGVELNYTITIHNSYIHTYIQRHRGIVQRVM